MGTEVQCKSYLPGYFSMRHCNQDSNDCSWPLHYGDKMLTNGQYYNGFLPRAVADAYSGCDKDVIKRTMLGHEAIFKSQVCNVCDHITFLTSIRSLYCDSIIYGLVVIG